MPPQGANGAISEVPVDSMVPVRDRITLDGRVVRAVFGELQSWAIDNHTPFAAERAWGRDKDGVPEWFVAVRGTFDIKPEGTLAIADEQSRRCSSEYNGDDGVSSLRYDVDLVAPKPTTDVLINGTAYAPKGRPARSSWSRCERRARGQEGDQGRRQSGAGTGRVRPSPRRQNRSPRSPSSTSALYGGYDRTDPDPKKQRMDPRNPVGCGLVVPEGQPLPNFEYQDGAGEGRPRRLRRAGQLLVASPGQGRHLRRGLAAGPVPAAFPWIGTLAPCCAHRRIAAEGTCVGVSRSSW